MTDAEMIVFADALKQMPFWMIAQEFRRKFDKRAYAENKAVCDDIAFLISVENKEKNI